MIHYKIMKFLSTPGLSLATIYVVACIMFIWNQGLFGESFIALILGLPWSMGFAYFEYFNASGWVAATLLIAPLILNAVILYWIGSLFGRNR